MKKNGTEKVEEYRWALTPAAKLLSTIKKTIAGDKHVETILKEVQKKIDAYFKEKGKQKAA